MTWEILSKDCIKRFQDEYIFDSYNSWGFSQIIFVSTVKFQSLYAEAKGIETVKVIFLMKPKV